MKTGSNPTPPISQPPERPAETGWRRIDPALVARARRGPLAAPNARP